MCHIELQNQPPFCFLPRIAATRGEVGKKDARKKNVKTERLNRYSSRNQTINAKSFDISLSRS